jgi:UDP-N-acetylglucosamine 2-epimerase (non-hydrolysing)
MSQPAAAHRVCLVIGTRPEAIKMAPVLAALRALPHLKPVVVATTQHREMLRQALDVFGIVPDIDLGLMQNGQDLSVFTARAFTALTDTFLTLKPAFVLVQGDTSTVTAAALAAFYQGIPMGHVEAGLRSYDLSSPFPEEVNRRIATCTATMHFAPTDEARTNLLAEGIPESDIVVTGNTVVDALQMVQPRDFFATPALNDVPWGKRRILLTTVHRRESLGDALESICDALETLVARYDDVDIVFPVHLNPRVRDVVQRRLAGHARIHLLEPIPYPDLLEVLRRAYLVLSDSGGIQEEVPSFRKPILILRDCTERPEVVNAGFGELVGTDSATIVARTAALLSDQNLYNIRTSGANPFGDGRASVHIATSIDDFLQRPARTHGPQRLKMAPLADMVAQLSLAS